MRLKTLATGITLAFVGLAASAAHAQSGSLGVETNSSTGAALGTQAGNTGIGVGNNVEIGVEAGADGASQAGGSSSQQAELHTGTRADADISASHRGEAGLESALESTTEARNDTAAEAAGRSHSALDAASSSLESVRQTGEHATKATGEAIGNLGTAAEAQGSASASGELH